MELNNFRDTSINERISRYRKLAGYTQEEAATALGLKKSTYARMEKHGNPKPELLMKLSNLYNVSLTILFYGTEKLNIPTVPDEPIRIQQPEPALPPPPPPMILTANEKSIINTLRSFSKEDLKRVMEFINGIYQEK